MSGALESHERRYVVARDVAVQAAGHEPGVTNDAPVRRAGFGMPARGVAFNFILRGEYLQIRESGRAGGDVANRPYHHFTRQIVDDTAAHHHVEATIRKEPRKIVNGSVHDVAALSETTHRIFARIDALIS